MKLVRPDGSVVDLGRFTDQVYSYQAPDGWQYHWSVAEGRRRAQARGEVGTISLSALGVTAAFLHAHYRGLDEAYARTTDLTKPLLFVPFQGQPLLIDGWHRLLKALLVGQDRLPAFFLTREEADACLVLKLPPGRGLDWGQARSS